MTLELGWAEPPFLTMRKRNSELAFNSAERGIVREKKRRMRYSLENMRNKDAEYEIEYAKEDIENI